MAVNLKSRQPDIRYLKDIRKMLYDQKWAKKAPNLELYYMHRGIKRKDGLRYDITVIPAKMLGQEFTKTKGHEHSNDYGEVYIVLKGRAIYLIQRYEKKQLKDIYAVKAKRGEAVVVPPHYGHITINPSTKEQLTEANWLCEKCQNIYDLFVKKQGACYFYTKSGWIKNKNYAKVPKLRFKKPLKKIPKNLDFLYGK